MVSFLLSFLTSTSPSIDPSKIVTKDEFDAKLAAAYQDVARIETPAEDVQILANLLGLSPGTLDKSGAGFKKGGEACGHCGRAFSVLDIAATGLQAHSKQFLVDVVTGKYGYVVNPVAQHAQFACYKCGKKPIVGGHKYDVIEYVSCPEEDPGSYS